MNNLLMLLLFLFFQTLFCSDSFSDIPSFVHLCKRSDPKLSECFIKTFYGMVPYIMRGIPEMNIPSMDPLYFPNLLFTVKTGIGGELQTGISNGKLTGAGNVLIKNATVDLEQARIASCLHFKKVRLQGTYKTKGKIILLELDSTGHVDFNISGMSIDWQWYGNFYKKSVNSQEYIKFHAINAKINIEKIKMRFDNLFKNNKELTDSINQIFNENIDDLQDELYPIVKNTIEELMLRYLNRVFELFPVSKFFP